MLRRILMVLLIVSSMGYSQELGEWRWATDTNEFTMDKKAHFLGSAGAYFFFRHKGYTEKESALYSFYLGFGKEVIDALLPYEKYGDWGGDGLRLENTSTTANAMSLMHFRVYDADWHIGNKYGTTNQSDFVFLAEGTNEKLRLDTNGRLKVGDNVRPASDANEGAGLRVTSS